MMSAPDPTQPPSATHAPTDDTLRPHSFDGIQEYDKRLPRWWLFTLYGAMVFAVIYWGYYETYGIGMSPARALEMEMAENTKQATSKSGVLDDDVLWRMSGDPAVIAAGKITFETTCAACHKPDLTGLIGPNLVDHEWIHGGNPMDNIKTINDGVLAKGMPAWGALLGSQKISEVVAFIYSYHQRGEKVIAVPGWTPVGMAPPAPAP
jgi:cytochrome c oxidase cbb3-type subunit III